MDDSTLGGNLRSVILPGVRGVRAVWRPFTLVLIGAAALVVAYYNVPAFARACGHIAELKQRFGYGFSIVGGMIAGAVVPEILKRLTLPGHRFRGRAGEIVMDSFYFAAMGAIVDTLYRALGVYLGTEPTWANATAKMLVDQFVFTPTFGVGIAAVYFPLRHSRWDFATIFGGFPGPAWYVRRVMPLLVPAWCFWIPMTFLVYSLPPLLQMPMTLTANAAWSMLLIAIARRRHTAAPIEARPPVR